MRVPIATLFLVLNGIFAGILQASMFSNVANAEFSWRDRGHNDKIVKNMLGLAFLSAGDQFIMMSMA